jgi:hypothetical protein
MWALDKLEFETPGLSKGCRKIVRKMGSEMVEKVFSMTQ